MSKNIQPTNYSDYYLVEKTNASCCNRWTFLQTVSGLTFVISTLAIAVILASTSTLGISALFMSYSGLALFFLPSFISGASLTLFICSGCLKNISSQSQIISIPSKTQKHEVSSRLSSQNNQDVVALVEEHQVEDDIIFVEPEDSTVADKDIQAIYQEHLDSVFKKFSHFFFQLISVHHSIDQKAFTSLLSNLWTFAKGLIFNDRFVATQLLSAVIKPLPFHLIKRQLIRAHNQNHEEAFTYYSKLHQAAKNRNDLSGLKILISNFQSSKKKNAEGLEAFIIGFLTILQEKQSVQTGKEDQKIEQIKDELIVHLSTNFSSYKKDQVFITACQKCIDELNTLSSKKLQDRKNREALNKVLIKLIDNMIEMAIQQDKEIGNFVEQVRAYVVTWTNDSAILTTYLKEKIPQFLKDVKVNLHILSQCYFGNGSKDTQLMQISNYMLCWENILFEEPLEFKDEDLLKAQYEINKGLGKKTIALIYVPKGTSIQEAFELPVVKTVLETSCTVEYLERLNQKYLAKLKNISKEADVIALPCKMEAYPLAVQKEFEGGNMSLMIKPFLTFAEKLIPWLHDNFNLNLPITIPGLPQGQNKQWAALVSKLIPYVSSLYFDLMLSKTHPIKSTFAMLLSKFSESFESQLGALSNSQEINLDSLEEGLFKLLEELGDSIKS